MTKEEFDTTKWYKGIKVRELESQRVFEVDLSWRTVSFWDGYMLKRLHHELIEIVEEEDE